MSESSRSDCALRPSLRENAQPNQDFKAVHQDNRRRIEDMFRMRTVDSPRSFNESSNTIQSDGMTVDYQFSDVIIERRKSHHQNDEDADDLDRAERNLLKKGQIPPPELRAKLMQRMKTDYFDALICEDYDKAAKLESATNFLGDVYECEAYIQTKEEAARLVEERLAAAQQHLTEEQKRWKHILDVHKREYKADRRALLAKQEEERKALEETWENPAQMMQFQKASSHLLVLRRQQKKLGLVKQYQEAKRVKRTADMLQLAETESAEERAMAAMQIAFENLEDKHKKELECFEEHQERTRQFIEAEKRKALHPVEKLIAQLETARNKDKPTNKKPNSIVFKSTRHTRAVRTQKALPKASPRTTRAFYDYKGAEDPPRLTLGSLNVKRIISSRRPVSVVRSRRR